MFFIESQICWINTNLISEIYREQGLSESYFYIIMNNGNKYPATKEEATKLINIIH